jgi:hypothetical protein
MSAGIRQYDIWIDGRKLSARLLEDGETRAGHRVLLKFDGCVEKLDAKTFETLKRTQKRKNYAKLGGYSIEFELQEDEGGKRVCISSRNSYLLWREWGEDGSEGPFVSFPNYPAGIQEELVFGRTYVFSYVKMDSSDDSVEEDDDEKEKLTNGVERESGMTLRVTDPLAGLEVGDWRAVDAVLDAPDDIGKRLEELLGVMKELTRE